MMRNNTNKNQELEIESSPSGFLVSPTPTQIAAAVSAAYQNHPIIISDIAPPQVPRIINAALQTLRQDAGISINRHFIPSETISPADMGLLFKEIFSKFRDSAHGSALLVPLQDSAKSGDKNAWFSAAEQLQKAYLQIGQAMATYVSPHTTGERPVADTDPPQLTLTTFFNYGGPQLKDGGGLVPVNRLTTKQRDNWAQFAKQTQTAYFNQFSPNGSAILDTLTASDSTIPSTEIATLKNRLLSSATENVLDSIAHNKEQGIKSKRLASFVEPGSPARVRYSTTGSIQDAAEEYVSLLYGNGGGAIPTLYSTYHADKSEGARLTVATEVVAAQTAKHITNLCLNRRQQLLSHALGLGQKSEEIQFKSMLDLIGDLTKNALGNTVLKGKSAEVQAAILAKANKQAYIAVKSTLDPTGIIAGEDANSSAITRAIHQVQSLQSFDAKLKNFEVTYLRSFSSKLHLLIRSHQRSNEGAFPDDDTLKGYIEQAREFPIIRTTSNGEKVLKSGPQTLLKDTTNTESAHSNLQKYKNAAYVSIYGGPPKTGSTAITDSELQQVYLRHAKSFSLNVLANYGYELNYDNADLTATAILNSNTALFPPGTSPATGDLHDGTVELLLSLTNLRETSLATTKLYHRTGTGNNTQITGIPTRASQPWSSLLRLRGSN